jgi:hypothetical protein
MIFRGLVPLVLAVSFVAGCERSRWTRADETQFMADCLGPDRVVLCRSGVIPRGVAVNSEAACRCVLDVAKHETEAYDPERLGEALSVGAAKEEAAACCAKHGPPRD